MPASKRDVVREGLRALRAYAASNPDLCDALDRALSDVERLPRGFVVHGAPVDTTWGQVLEGDAAITPKGAEVPVVDVFPAVNGQVRVVLKYNGQDRPFWYPVSQPVQVKRGAHGCAMDILSAAGLGPALLGGE